MNRFLRLIVLIFAIDSATAVVGSADVGGLRAVRRGRRGARQRAAD